MGFLGHGASLPPTPTPVLPVGKAEPQGSRPGAMRSLGSWGLHQGRRGLPPPQLPAPPGQPSAAFSSAPSGLLSGFTGTRFHWNESGHVGPVPRARHGQGCPHRGVRFTQSLAGAKGSHEQVPGKGLSRPREPHRQRPGREPGSRVVSSEKEGFGFPGRGFWAEKDKAVSWAVGCTGPRRGHWHWQERPVWKPPGQDR